jgi:aspartate/methionine/tyrosine aminotransferase
MKWAWNAHRRRARSMPFPTWKRFTKQPHRAQILLEKAHIATIPGSVFGAQGEGHLRFGYAITMKEIEDCVEALRKFFA